MEADSACFTLGYTNGGSYQTFYMEEWSEPEIPFLMDDVECGSASTNFLSCSSNGWGLHDCGHNENVILTCYPNPIVNIVSGKGFDHFQVFCPDF